MTPPASTWSSNGIDSRGRLIFTSHHEPEHWRVVVRDGDQVRSVEVGAALWSCAAPGATLTTCYRVGRWTGLHWMESLNVPSQPEAAP